MFRGAFGTDKNMIFSEFAQVSRDKSARQGEIALMKIMPKNILLTITALIFLSAIFSTLSCTKNEPPAIIGAALALSGPAASVGEDVRNGLLLAAEEINEQGGINGSRVQIMVRDAVAQGKSLSGGDGSPSDDPAQKAFEELLQADPLVVVSSLSFLSMKLAPVAEAKKRLLVGLVATVPALTQGRDWVYRYWPTAEHEAPPMTDIFLKIGSQNDTDNSVKVINSPTEVSLPLSLGVIYLDDDYGVSVFADMVKRSKDKGIKVIPSPFSSDNKDFSVTVNAVKDTKAVAVIGFDFHIIKTLKALRAIKYKGEIISTTTATLPSVTSTPESSGVYLTAPALYNKNYPFADEVRKRYEDKYGKPFTQYAANGYDFVYILIGLLEDKPMNQDTVKAIFEKGFVYSGLFGNIELKKGSKDILFPLFPAQIVNGEIIYR